MATAFIPSKLSFMVEYQHAAKIAPNLFEAHYRLAQAYVRTGQLAEAVESYKGRCRSQMHKEELKTRDKYRTPLTPVVLAWRRPSEQIVKLIGHAPRRLRYITPWKTNK